MVCLVADTPPFPRLVLHAHTYQLQHRAVRAKRDERRRAEKRIRILVDDLRYALKKVDPPIDVDTATYEEVVPLVNETDEWKALEGNEDARKQAWEKFVRRQKVRFHSFAQISE